MRRTLTLGTIAVASTFAFASATFGQGKPRVYITDSNSWEMKGSVGIADASGGGSVGGGARPQTAEIIKTFRERCPDVTVTMNREKADFVVLLEHEGGKDLFRRDNKVVLTDKDGDVFFTNSTRSLGNAVKDTCAAIRSHGSRVGSSDAGENN